MFKIQQIKSQPLEDQDIYVLNIRLVFCPCVATGTYYKGIKKNSHTKWYIFIKKNKPIKKKLFNNIHEWHLKNIIQSIQKFLKWHLKNEKKSWPIEKSNIKYGSLGKFSFMATFLWRNCKEKISVTSVQRTKYRLQHNKCQFITT